MTGHQAVYDVSLLNTKTLISIFCDSNFYLIFFTSTVISSGNSAFIQWRHKAQKLPRAR